MSESGQKSPIINREPSITVYVNGNPIAAFAGETVAAVLLGQGIRRFRHTVKRGEPRGIFCGIGVCYECLVTVDGVPNVRACATAVSPGMKIATEQARPAHELSD
jgi:predicted molibdopterin-dependent oxidoreductase YjgC